MVPMQHLEQQVTVYNIVHEFDVTYRKMDAEKLSFILWTKVIANQIILGWVNLPNKNPVRGTSPVLKLGDRTLLHGVQCLPKKDLKCSSNELSQTAYSLEKNEDNTLVCGNSICFQNIAILWENCVCCCSQQQPFNPQ